MSTLIAKGMTISNANMSNKRGTNSDFCFRGRCVGFFWRGLLIFVDETKPPEPKISPKVWFSSKCLFDSLFAAFRAGSWGLQQQRFNSLLQFGFAEWTDIHTI